MRANLTALIALFVAGTVSAQAVHTKPAAPTPAKGGTTGTAAGTVAAVAPPPVIIVVPGNASVVAPPGSVIANAPLIVLPDGRVFADFGHGYEQIVRGCGYGYSANTVYNTPLYGQPSVGQPVVVQPPVVVNQSPPPQNFTPNIPIPQPAYPLQSSVPFRVNPYNTYNSVACWGTNGLGQVFVAHP